MDYDLTQPFVGLGGLVRMAESAEEMWAAAQARNSGIGPFPYQFYLSYLTIVTILGLATDNMAQAITWGNTNLLPHPRDRKTEYLNTNPQSIEEFRTHLVRCVGLAELLYNLQSIKGLISIVRRLVSNPSQLEATILELEGMRLLWSAKLPFRIAHSGAGQGLNYECEVLLPNDVIAYCEMKCKIETSEFSAQGIASTLRHARKQLPTGKCGVIILKVPERWTTDSNTRPELDLTIQNMMRQSTRISEVICYYKSYEMTQTQTAEFFSVRELLNRTSPYTQLLDGGLIRDRINLGSPGRWWSFGNFNNAEAVRQRVDEDLRARGKRDGLGGLLRKLALGDRGN